MHRILAIDVPGRREGGYTLWERGRYVIGPIYFDPTRAEREDYRELEQLLQSTDPRIVITETGQLRAISRWVYAIHFWCSIYGRAYVQYTPSHCKKVVLGNGNASKIDVLTWAKGEIAELAKSHRVEAHNLTQHQADSLLYLRTWKKEQGNATILDSPNLRPVLVEPKH